MNIYSVLDTKTGRYNTPFFCSTDVDAQRMFIELVMDQRSVVSRHASDFALMLIGKWDGEKGECSPSSPQVTVLAGTHARAQGLALVEQDAALTAQAAGPVRRSVQKNFPPKAGNQ